MNSLNEYFDKIYCINLDKRPDRWDKCSKLFSSNNLEVERFSAIDKINLIGRNVNIKHGEFACLLSHMAVLNMAKNNNYNKILIFEDDVSFEDDISNVFKNNIDKVPDNWKMLYFGGNHQFGLDQIDDNIYKLKGSYTTHAYAIKCDIIPDIVKTIEPANVPIDVYYANMHRIYPSFLIKNGNKHIAWQSDNYSDINDSECDYSFLKI
jgi:glycosyl transferase family 25